MSDSFIVVIPAFNEEKNIASVIDGVKKHLEQVIVVDDGSQDNTFKEAELAGAVVLRHEKNLGKGAALKTGFAHTLKHFPDCEAIIILDADGQHNPEEIPKFIDVFQKTGADLILGERMINRREMPFLRRVGNSAVSWLISRKIGQKISDSQTGFRLFSRKFLENFNPESTGYAVETEIILAAVRASFKINTIPVSAKYLNKNSLNFLKDLRIIISISKIILSR